MEADALRELGRVERLGPGLELKEDARSPLVAEGSVASRVEGPEPIAP
jgi:hypothetical protein